MHFPLHDHFKNLQGFVWVVASFVCQLAAWLDGVVGHALLIGSASKGSMRLGWGSSDDVSDQSQAMFVSCVPFSCRQSW